MSIINCSVSLSYKHTLFILFVQIDVAC